jgi:hypothetical protein
MIGDRIDCRGLEIAADGNPGLAAFAAARGFTLTAGLFAGRR